MSPKVKSTKAMGSELRALRDQRLAGPVSEAGRREASFLRNVTGAGDDLEWILLNQAWTQLGFERVGDWWEQRVLPVLDKLDLRPSASLAERVIAAIEADEATLPKVQRRTQREIASIAKTSQSRVSRLLADSRASGSDLETPGRAAAEPAAEDIPDAVRQSIKDATERAVNVGAGVVVPLHRGDGVLCPVGVDHEHCAVCGKDIASPDQQGGYLRCRKCDPRQEHIALPTLDAQWGDCRLCTKVSATAIAETPPDPSEAGLVEPAGADQAAVLAGTTTAVEVDASPEGDSTDGVRLPADGAFRPPTGTPAPAGDGLPSSLAGVTPEDSPAVVPSGGGVSSVLRQPGAQPEERIECPDCAFVAAVDGGDAEVALHELEEHLRQSHDYPNAEIHDVLVNAALAYSPAAGTALPGDDTSYPFVSEPQQPGHDSVGSDGGPRISPTGQDHEESHADDVTGGELSAVATPGRSEIQLHGGGEAPAREGAVEPVLEGDDAAMTSPSSDPTTSVGILVAVFTDLADRLDRDLDHDVVGPLLLDDDLRRLHDAVDRIAGHVALLERWRTP